MVLISAKAQFFSPSRPYLFWGPRDFLSNT